MGDDAVAQVGGRVKRVVFAWAVVFLSAVAWGVSVGDGGSWVVRIASVVEVVTISLWMPIVYVVGAWGFGRMVWRPVRTDGGAMAWVARLGVGIALMLSVTHGLGVLGMLNSASAWVVTGVGIGLAGVGFKRDWARIDRAIKGWSPEWVDVVFGGVVAAVVGLMVVAACEPAGVLWDSEYGNYDSLSYHLELAREWMELGRVRPVEWNVYSFLPSYVEAAYVHMGLLGSGGGDGLGLASGKGEGIYAAQFLSVVFAVLGAMVSGAVAKRACGVLGVDERGWGLVGWVAAVVVMTTPWMVVVGTISYNESAVVVLTMCGIGIAMETGWSVMRRTVGCAVVMGVACSCKPTALFLACPMVGVVLLSLVPVKAWWRVVLVGSVVGVVVLVPWLVRNELVAGNPVFPQLSSVFGSGHWDAGQVERYAGAHRFDGSWVERVRLLVLPDADGTTHVERFRGLTNRQWGVTAGMGIVGLIVLMLRRKTHLAGVVCAVGVGMVVVCWLGLTHLQSRFLVPMVGVFGVMGAVGVGSVGWRLARVVVPLVVVIPMGVLGYQWSGEAGGHPNGMLVAGVGAFTGEMGSVGYGEVLWWNGVNETARDGRGVYLVGDATAVYVRSPVVYNTTYDAWLIGALMREHPEDAGAWNRALVERGIGWVVINLGEIERLARSGWGDPSVTSDAVVEWSRTLGEPVRVWNHGRRVMFRIGFEGEHE